MKNHIYKQIELTGTSPSSIEDAVGRALKRAHKTVRNLDWFEVMGTRGTILKGRVRQWQVTLKVGFTLSE